MVSATTRSVRSSSEVELRYAVARAAISGGYPVRCRTRMSVSTNALTGDWQPAQNESCKSLRPICAHAHDDLGTQARFLESHVEVDAVGVHVDVVDVLQRPVGELVAFTLPLGGEPGDHRGGQAGGRSEELLQGGHEVSRAHPV